MTRARVGLVGAGPWAHDFTAPMLAGSDDLDLAGVWARNPERATAVADAHGVGAFDDLDELVTEVDAIAFAVAPDAQADLVARLAPSGLPMLLEKPLALAVPEASATVDVLDRFDVATMMVLTNRFIDPIARLLDGVEAIEPHGARAEFIGAGAIDGNRYATPWRLAEGAVFDLGPHVLDVLEAACGPIVEIDAAGDPHGVVELVCRHESGTATSASVSVTTPGEPSGLGLTVWGRRDRRSTVVSWNDDRVGPRLFEQAKTRVAGAFAETIARGTSHELDARHGLHLQDLLERASVALGVR